ncbi:ParB/RepB/Spo0J family partition protein [Vallitalea okinawensis]|uniref:ParB/RepB/Spo0J family partition protein n=1 Tax=Vallitalea okinawensis TaxID=2078660 RepID=UPI000CFE052C|nr:ParB/RepB/Spo0J family partition protein [Vallitalea okinawensis]
MKFNVEEAIVYSEKGKIEEWVHLFLNSEGDNFAFSEGLKLQKRYWLGPIIYDLDKINRCCGPEKDIKFHEPYENWENRIKRMEDLIKQGWEMAPLIVNHDKGYLEINDGNHRHEALKRAGINKFWVIFWDSEDENNLIQLSKEKYYE